jgi:hypothetical protein
VVYVRDMFLQIFQCLIAVGASCKRPIAPDVRLSLGLQWTIYTIWRRLAG